MKKLLIAGAAVVCMSVTGAAQDANQYEPFWDGSDLLGGILMVIGLVAVLSWSDKRRRRTAIGDIAPLPLPRPVNRVKGGLKDGL